MLSCLVLGLLLLTVTGFSASVPQWFYPAVLLICAAAVLIYRSRFCARYWPGVLIVLLLAYLAVLYLNQEAFLRGMRSFGGLMAYQIQTAYSSDIPVAFPGSGGMDTVVFLLLICVPAVFWLGMSLCVTNGFLPAYLLIFPLVALLSLSGAAHHTAALFLILFGIVLGMTFSRPRKQRRMWGGADRELFAQNKARYESIQKRAAAIVLTACVALSVPGFLIVRPLLAISLKPAEELSVRLQSDFLNRVMKLLPELSAGQWKLNLEAIGGGVQDGALNSGEGYLLEGVEDLRLTLNRKPQETLFLRGYVGKSYDSGSWAAPSGTTFDGAALNWNTEGSARVYIQNLPFLRTAYALAGGMQEPETAEKMAAVSAEPGQLLVERINANDSYTYVPYGVYLNDYYRVDAGDGAVAGQKEQEDRFLFFSREDLETVLSTWNGLSDTANVLDRVEESYRAFCQTDSVSFPEKLEPFYVTIRSVMVENRWNTQEHLDEITAWIRRYLAQNYEYQLFPPEVPEGMDELEYFLLESKAGNSVHFASAAVVFYRMFGIPARYVVGYEIPSALFTVQANGIYTATVQGDNSQAWAEIYEPGIGWMPRDMTPGVIGTYEEVGPGGEKIEAVIAETEPEAPTAEHMETGPLWETVPDGEEAPLEKRPLTVGQVVLFFLWIILAFLGIVGGAVLWGRISRALGLRTIRRRSRQTRLLGVFQAFYRRMHRLGLPKEADSQTEEFCQFSEAQLRRRDPAAAAAFRPAMQRLFACCYGSETATESDIQTLRRLLKAAWKRPDKK